MKQKVLYFGALFLLMLITGVFWGTWFTLTRSIDSFSSGEFMHIGRVIIANVAIPMRIILPAGIVLVILSLWLYEGKKTAGFYFGILSLILIMAVLLITLTVLVPIDNSIKTWTISTLPSNWEIIQDKWKTFHAARTLASLISFASYSMFLILPGPVTEEKGKIKLPVFEDDF
jgi:hypothetical protein